MNPPVATAKKIERTGSRSCCIPAHASCQPHPVSPSTDRDSTDRDNICGAPVCLPSRNMQATATHPVDVGGRSTVVHSPRCPHSSVSCTAAPQRCRTVNRHHATAQTETTTQAQRTRRSLPHKIHQRKAASVSTAQTSPCQMNHTSTQSAGPEPETTAAGVQAQKC